MVGSSNRSTISGSYAAGNVSGRRDVGGLVGDSAGTISASYATGSVSGNEYVGGLVGSSVSAPITASYATGNASGDDYIGGLVGWDSGTTITASYAVGRVSASGNTSNIGGLVGSGGLGFITASYWDTETTGQAGSYGGIGKTTAELQSPTDYAGIYTEWNLDLDGDDSSDDPWHFGNSRQYPALQYGGLDLPAQRLTPQPTLTGTTDYDTDQDGLIEISNLAQLAAIRADLNGDGISPAPTYAAAFPNAMPGMGCPDAACTGYELIANLDFDTNGNGAPDAGDTYWNDGAGWVPIGDEDHNFTADFDGNNHTIANLYIDRSDTDNVGLFGSISGSSIKRVGLVSATVSGHYSVGSLVGNGYGSVITASYATGSVRGGNSHVGGLIGRIDRGTIVSSYATSNVSGKQASTGGLVGYSSHYSTIIASYAMGSVFGGYRVGGLVGGNALYSTITASYATGRVSGDRQVGGLVGWNEYGTITSSYAIGHVSATNATPYIGGLVGDDKQGTTTASYWNTETTGQAGSYGGIGKTTAELQSPTDYTGIYAGWNLDLDSDSAADDPWHFGNSRQYPALQYASLDPAAQRR